MRTATSSFADGSSVSGSSLSTVGLGERRGAGDAAGEGDGDRRWEDGKGLIAARKRRGGCGWRVSASPIGKVEVEDE